MIVLGAQDGTPQIKYLESNQTDYPLTMTVPSSSTADDPRAWVVAYYVVTRVYNGPGPWEVEFSGCCLAKSPQQAYSVRARVHMGQASQSPTIVAVPSFRMQSDSSAWIGADSRSSTDLLWTLDNSWVYSGYVAGITLSPTTGLLSVTPNSTGSAYLKVIVSSGFSSTSAIMSFDTNSSGVKSPLSGSPNPSPNAQPFGAASPLVLDYNFYTGFPFQITLPLTTMPTGAWMTANSNLNGCCYPFHSVQTLTGFSIGDGVLAPITMNVNLMANQKSPSLSIGWNRPCQGNVGRAIFCMSMADSVNVVNSTLSLCLRLSVIDNPPPVFIRPVEQQLVWTMGQLGTINVEVQDPAPQDSVSLLDISSNTTLPSGATFASQLAGSRATGRLEWVPLAGSGGGAYTICFASADRKVSPYDHCVVGQRTSMRCVTINVVRCRYVPRTRESLMDIAFLFQTDWIQLWALNPDITKPDFGVGDEVSILNTGHLFKVGSGDYLTGIAYKMGVTVKSLLLHNADLAQAGSEEALPTGKTICVMPSSCKRESS